MELFPPIEPYREFFLPVSELHTIHVEEAGNPDGAPVVFLHGGPGGGIEPVYRQYFHPEKYRIILFDQRGCGQSTPFASLEENTTWDLVEDIEKIRRHLGIDRWVVFGGSWGSTLALAYAETHPDSVKALVLRGIFLLRQRELDWFYQDGANHLFPDAWEEFLAPIPPERRGNLLESYYEYLTSADKSVRQTAATAWSVWEGSTSKLIPDEGLRERFAESEFSEAFSRIECHYFYHKGWFEPEDQLLQNVDRIRSIPATIVQGRYDVVCPLETAWELHKAWPEAEFHIVKDAGHSVTEPGIRSLLIEATEKYSTL
ncbi:MAG: prolyl aminopeptidase [Candidatus Neomarinimicrobiota bacterium]|nr:MAG: prolyl aminopeptidase [Candidatus Neomarinimicrobiota bacterium]